MKSALIVKAATVTVGILAAGPAVQFHSDARAQDYPSRTVTIIVPFAPGGSPDIFGRLIAQRLTAAFGRSVIVDNRGGAGGNVGTEAVVRAAPDGHTVLYTTAAIAVSRALYPKFAVNPERDLAAVSQTVMFPMLLVVHSSLPARSVKDLLALAKANPGTLAYSSPGSGTVPHLGMELLKLDTRLDARHIPYKGGGPAQIALLTGEVQFAFLGVATSRPHLSSGKMRPLGVSERKRTAALPDVPTLHEAGVKDFEALNWHGFFVSAKTPAAVAARFHSELVKMLATAEMKERFATEGADIVGSTPAEFAVFFAAESRKWSDVVARSSTVVE